MELNNIDIKALQFRDELIKLCNKYKCQISGISNDSGDVYLDFDNVKTYIISDGYKIWDYNEDFEQQYIMDRYIQSKTKNSYISPDWCKYINKNVGIFTNDYNKALNRITEIKNSIDEENISKFIESKFDIRLILNDGTNYKWIRPNQNSRGNKCTKAIIDRDLTLEEIENRVLVTGMPTFIADNIEMF